LLPNAPRPLRSRQRVRVHTGAAEVLARVRVLESGGEIKPGQSGFVQLRTEAPIVGVLGDRFILRSYSPQVTIGGGLILDSFPPKHRPRDLAAAHARLEILAEGNRVQQLAGFVAGSERSGLRRADLAARTGWRDEVIDETTRQALADGAIIDAEGVLISRERFDELKRLVLEEIAAHHKREPLLRGLAKEILRERFFAHAPVELFRGVLAHLEKDGALIAEKEMVRLREHTRELSQEDSGLRDRLEKIYREAALAAPSLNQAFELSGASPQQGRKILQLLIDSGMLVKVHGEMYFHRTALDDLTRRLRDYGAKQMDRTIDVAAFKELAGISRKYAIPLLEYLDRQRVTRREGDRRVIL
jgi:selenocysteine-specific elongation factor